MVQVEPFHNGMDRKSGEKIYSIWTGFMNTYKQY